MTKDKHPTDSGVWVCTACGKEIYGERYEPPLDHAHNCEEYSGNDLEFREND